MISIMLILFWWFLYLSKIRAYTVQGRFGHSAVVVNDSIYFYGGDSSVSSTSVNDTVYISDLAILPVHSPYQLTDPPWKPASGPQTSVGGPAVYSHVAFMGGTNNGNMIIIGGVMPQTDNLVTDEEPTAYSYDCDLGRWNSFSLPSGNHLNRQGAACTITEHGIAYIWGGKRATVSPPPTTTTTTALNATTKSILSANMYRFDSVYPANSTVVASDAQIYPPLRYAHTQTLISDHRIVVLGGFNSATGDAVSLADVWVFDISTSQWSQISAKLDKENKPANRSSHSQVLMPDGYSILVYGGYDGYNVYNDVAVLDTRTWTWTLKNTNAAVQGRADHTATLVNTNMIVAFGFTGVSTALTVMADIEVLDIVTWSWTSVYTPSPNYNVEGGGSGNQNGIGESSQSGNNVPSSPSIAIVAGAVTGGLVVFVLLLIAFYMINTHQQKRNGGKNSNSNKSGSSSENSSTSNLSSTLSSIPAAQLQREESRNNQRNNNNTNHHHHYQQQRYPHHHQNYPNEMIEVSFKDPPSSTEPFEYYNNSSSQSRRPSSSNAPPHPLQISTYGLPPARSDTINTSTTVVTNASSPIMLVPSPWSRMRSQSISEEKQQVIFTRSPCSSSSDWMIRRAVSSPTHHHPMQSIATISKPDDRCYPPSNNNSSNNNLRRAATVSELSNSMISLSTNNSSTATITAKNVTTATRDNNNITTTSNTNKNHGNEHFTTTNNQEEEKEVAIDINDKQDDEKVEKQPHNNRSDDIEDEDDDRFDRQEFILTSDEVAKIEDYNSALPFPSPPLLSSSFTDDSSTTTSSSTTTTTV